MIHSVDRCREGSANIRSQYWKIRYMELCPRIVWKKRLRYSSARTIMNTHEKWYINNKKTPCFLFSFLLITPVFCEELPQNKGCGYCIGLFHEHNTSTITCGRRRDKTRKFTIFPPFFLFLSDYNCVTPRCATIEIPSIEYQKHLIRPIFTSNKSRSLNSVISLNVSFRRSPALIEVILFILEAKQGVKFRWQLPGTCFPVSPHKLLLIKEILPVETSLDTVGVFLRIGMPIFL